MARACAPAATGAEAYLVTPDDIVEETRGHGNATRLIRHVLEADDWQSISFWSNASPRRGTGPATRRTSMTPRTTPPKRIWRRRTTIGSTPRPGSAFSAFTPPAGISTRFY